MLSYSDLLRPIAVNAQNILHSEVHLHVRCCHGCRHRNDKRCLGIDRSGRQREPSSLADAPISDSCCIYMRTAGQRITCRGAILRENLKVVMAFVTAGGPASTPVIHKNRDTERRKDVLEVLVEWQILRWRRGPVQHHNCRSRMLARLIVKRSAQSRPTA